MIIFKDAMETIFGLLINSPIITFTYLALLFFDLYKLSFTSINTMFYKFLNVSQHIFFC